MNGDKEINENLKSYVRESGEPTHGNKHAKRRVGKLVMVMIRKSPGHSLSFKERFEDWDYEY